MNVFTDLITDNKGVLIVAALTVVMASLITTIPPVYASEPFLGETRCFGFNFPPRNWAQMDGQILPINSFQSLFSLLGTTYGGDGRSTFGLPDMRGRTMMHEGSSGGPSHPLGQKAGEETHALTTPEIPSHNHGLGDALKLRLQGHDATGDTFRAAPDIIKSNVLTSLSDLTTSLNALTSDPDVVAIANAISNAQSFINQNPSNYASALVALLSVKSNVVNLNDTAVTDDYNSTIALLEGHSLGLSMARSYSTSVPNFVMHSDSILLDKTLATHSTTSNTGSNQGHNNMQPFLAVNCAIALQGLFPSR